VVCISNGDLSAAAFAGGHGRQLYALLICSQTVTHAVCAVLHKIKCSSDLSNGKPSADTAANELLLQHDACSVFHTAETKQLQQ
jgi:hypothetical protein